jgi:hypothetical protein
LGDEPEEQVDDRGQFDGGEHEEQRHEADDAGLREQQHVGAQNAGNGAAGTDHRNAAAGHEEDLEQGSGDATHDVEDQVAKVAHALLDVVAEDEQGPHVAEEVKPAAVDEHGTEKCGPDLEASWRGNKAGRDETPREDKLLKPLRTEPKLGEKDEAVQGDEDEIDDRNAPTALRVVEREHA